MESTDNNSFQEPDEQFDASAKFQKRVKSFLKFNFTIFILMLVGVKLAILWKISIIWGAFLAFSAWSENGGKCSNRRSKSKHSREQYGRPQRSNWRDKDLV